MIALVPGLVAAVAFLAAVRVLRRKRLLEDVPTSKAKGVFLGLNEVKGTVECARPLRSRLAGIPCVFYRFEIREHWEYTTTSTDGKGRTTTRHHSGWKTIDAGERRRFFDLRDETGALRIRPRRAEIEAECVFDRVCGTLDPLYYDKGPPEAVPHSTHRRRFTESAIPVGARVYVIGPARLRRDAVAPEIAWSRGGGIFLVSTRSERRLLRSYGRSLAAAVLLGAVAAFCVPVLHGAARVGGFGRALELRAGAGLGAAGIFFGLLGLSTLFLAYNRLVAVRERVRMAESLIDVQLRRRADLIPRLAACVRGYARHEREVQEDLAGLRASGGGRHAQAAGQRGVLRRLFALKERYPALGADESSLALQRELADAEDRIALAREFYNASARLYADRIGSFPDAILARLAGFRPLPLLEAAPFERVVPRA